MHDPHTNDGQLEVMDTDPGNTLIMDAFVARRRHAVDRVRQWRRLRTRRRWGWLRDLWNPRPDARAR